MLGNPIAIKKTERSGDGLTPQQQFEAGKVLQRAIELAGLENVVEVNNALGFVQGEKNNFLFLEKIDGYNFQQMQKGEVEQIELPKIIEIIEDLVKKLLDLKDKIESDPDFIQAKKIVSENKLEQLFRKLNYINKSTDFDSNIRKQNSEKYPKGYKETIEDYKYFYDDKVGRFRIGRIEALVKELEVQKASPDHKSIYNLISQCLFFLLMEDKRIDVSYVVDINKRVSYGQDNLMYDQTKQKIIIIDPGPAVRQR